MKKWRTVILLITLGSAAGLAVLGSRPETTVREGRGAGSETGTRAKPGPSTEHSPTQMTTAIHHSLLNGRITTHGGTTYQGRLRFAGDEEALWNHAFNGHKEENSWAELVPPEELPSQRRSFGLFGVELAARETPLDLQRPFMARFGDISRIEATGTDVLVTLKNGTSVTLDRLSASDFDDGLRIWDHRRGMVDLDSMQIRVIELLPAGNGSGPGPLFGTVHTRTGDFTGTLQWNRTASVGSDELTGRTADGIIRLRFDAIQSISRHSAGGVVVTLTDGREIELSGTGEVGNAHRGIFVDDRRYGRALVSWNIIETVVFEPGGTIPAYDDFPPGFPLTGSVSTRSGRQLAGRLIYDLDESETTETLDAPGEGVTYTIPFGLIARIELPTTGSHATVTLHHGDRLQLEHAGDLGRLNAGMLIIGDAGQPPEYVPWDDVELVEIDRPDEMYPPFEIDRGDGTPGT